VYGGALPYFLLVIKSNRLDAWGILHYLNAEEVHGVLVGNPEAKRSCGRLGLRYELQVNTRHLSLS
jgi:hypothetical protein